jgi:hypothetical protein
MDIPDIVGDEESASAGERARSLFFLGRRLERLFLGGVLLVVLSFLSVLFTTVNKQLKEDSTAASVALLEERIIHDKEHLTELFQHRNDPAPRAIAAPTPERIRALSETRKKLGLPELAPTPPAQPPLPESKERYADVLGKLVQDVIRKTKAADLPLILKLEDLTVSPDDLLKKVTDQRVLLEAKPASFWGIETPRALRLTYADQNYIVPYGVISILILIPLPILILGWLAAVYMTRQRELIIIAELRDYKQAFPHILNFLPVDFTRLFPKSKISKRDLAQTHRSNRIFLVIVRSTVIVMFCLPIVFGFAYSMSIAWELSGELASPLFAIGALAFVVMLFQVIVLVSQEAFLLRGKLFTE